MTALVIKERDSSSSGDADQGLTWNDLNQIWIEIQVRRMSQFHSLGKKDPSNLALLREYTGFMILWIFVPISNICGLSTAQN